MSTTLILGGGFGGLAAARALREQAPRDHRIVLVDRAPEFLVGASKTWVMLGERTADSITTRRDHLLPDGVTLIEAEVNRVDVARREVETTAGAFSGDQLVIALGAELDTGAVPGLEEAAHSFYTLAGAERLREALDAFAGGRVVLLIPRTPFKCPPAPYEAALLLQDAFARRGLAVRSSLEVWTVEKAPMATAGPEMGRLIEGLLRERGIGFHAQSKTASVDGARRIVRFESGREIPFNLLIAIPPHRVPRIAVEAGIAESGGWVDVDPATLAVRAAGAAPHVYAIGDLTRVALPGRFDPAVPLVLPKAGVFAAAGGQVVAARIAAALRGESSEAALDGTGFCYIETSAGRALRGDGSFFERPHPVMRHQPPDAAQFHDKLAWVESWMKPVR